MVQLRVLTVIKLELNPYLYRSVNPIYIGQSTICSLIKLESQPFAHYKYWSVNHLLINYIGPSTICSLIILVSQPFAHYLYWSVTHLLIINIGQSTICSLIIWVSQPFAH